MPFQIPPGYDVLFVIGPGACLTQAACLPGKLFQVPFDDRTRIFSLPINGSGWQTLGLWVKPFCSLSRYDPLMTFNPPLRSMAVRLFTPNRSIGHYNHGFRVKEDAFVHGGVSNTDAQVLCAAIYNAPTKLILGVRYLPDWQYGIVDGEIKIKEVEWTKPTEGKHEEVKDDERAD